MDEFECFFQCGRPSKDQPDQPKVAAAIRRAVEENLRDQEEILIESHHNLPSNNDEERSSLMEEEEYKFQKVCSMQFEYQSPAI